MTIYNKTMKYLVALLFITFSTSAHSQSINIKAMTYNIRYDNPDDGDNQWKNRKDELAKFINQQSPDFLGIQEGLQHQVEELAEKCTSYNWVGVARDNGDNQGEFVPIFYNKNKFNLLQTGTFWLSETPNIIGTKGWDAALPRVATWATFEEKLTGKQLLIVNTHFDHKGSWARQKSAQLILKKINELKTNNELTILLGDFNVTPHDEVYRTLTQNSGFADTETLSKYPPIGPRGTFNNFKNIHRQKRIDYIFTPPLTNILSYQVFQPKYNKKQLSDHYPVMIELFF